MPLAHEPVHDFLGSRTRLDLETLLEKPVIENLPGQAEAVDYAGLAAFVADLSSLENPIGECRRGLEYLKRYDGVAILDRSRDFMLAKAEPWHDPW